MLLVDGERYVQERFELLKLVKPGGTVLEVGANIGYTMLLLARAVGPSGRVVCVEPVPENLEELRLNVDANQLRNVSILALAAGDFDGSTRMEGGLNGRVAREGELEVEVRRIDSITSEALDVIKVDVEGYELCVLKGASKLLRCQKPSWWIEMHPQLVESLDELRELLGILADHQYHLRAFRLRLSSTVLQRVIERYSGIPGLESSERPDEWICEAESGGRNDSFWVSAVGRK